MVDGRGRHAAIVLVEMLASIIWRSLIKGIKCGALIDPSHLIHIKIRLIVMREPSENYAILFNFVQSLFLAFSHRNDGKTLSS